MSNQVLITGSGGLIGSEAVRFFCKEGFDVVGVDNDMRRYFFGDKASTDWNTKNLTGNLKNFQHEDIDIRNEEAVMELFKKHEFDLIIHTAAQPSHDWAAKEPFTDFDINARGTLNLLEAIRQHCKDAVFLFTSTNKVYGDTPNQLPLVELETRWECDENHAFYKGIDESMSIDHSKHSIFGVSKLSADLMVQEYGRYFGMKTMLFRGGCLTGPMHSGAELHGFLAYLVQCIITGHPYTIFGYQGKQVRDNIHSADLIEAFYQAYKKPRIGEVYNMGGGRQSNISMKEAILKIEALTGNEANISYAEENRSGDHIWYISDLSKFKNHYPEWDIRHDMDQILKEMVEVMSSRHPA